MFVCLYDKSLKALFKSWSTYATTKWSLTRKAYEFDELSVTTREVASSVNAMYVGLHNDDGSLKYLAYCGKPTTKEGLTTYKGVDLRQILQSELAVDLSNVALSDIYDQQSGSVSKTKLQQVFEYLMGLCFNQANTGYGGTGEATIGYDTSDLGENPPTWHEEYMDRTPAVANVWKVLQGFCMMYDCYIEALVSIDELTITFKVRRIYEEVAFKLSDFNESRVQSDNTVTNRMVVRYTSDADSNPIGSVNKTLYLLANDTVVQASQLSNTAPEGDVLNSQLIICPPRIETIVTEDLNTGIANAYKKLLENRFQGKVEIGTDCAMGYVLKQISFNTFGKIYGYNAADNRNYRRLPLMAIQEDSTGKYKVAFGRLQSYWY